MAKNGAAELHGPPGEAALAEPESLEHTTSIAVWDVPSPLTIRRRSKIKVGVKCPEECSLAAASVAIFDETGTRIAAATLRSVPWGQTQALYWAEVDLPGVAAEGPHRWSAEFVPLAPDASQHTICHRPSSFSFSVQAVRPPEHSVTIRIVEERTQSPVENVELRFGVYKARSESSGLAVFEVPAGTYELSLWKAGCQAAPRSVEVNGNLTMDVEVSKLPEVQDPYWMG